MEPPYVRMGSSAEAEALMKVPGQWTVANLHQSVGWTDKLATIDYAGATLILLPETPDHLPAIAAKGDADAMRRTLLEFAGALAWCNVGAVTIQYWTGGSQIFRAAKKPMGGQVTRATFQVNYLPAPTEANRKLALALFHEGSGLLYVHTAYSFLSFYKIINLVSGRNGKQQVAWINGHVAQMKNHRASQRLGELQAAGSDIGQYLYQSCRCAIAHAGDPRNPIIDPHNLEDQRRLNADIPLIITLAEIAIEEMGVKTSQTVYREHRYELSGFAEVLDPDLVKRLMAGESIASGSTELPSPFSIRMWGKQPYPPLESMVAESCRAIDGVLTIACRSASKRYLAYVLLDFPNYRLKTEIMLESPDDGSAEFIDEVIEIDRFFWEFNGNGCLEVWSGDFSVCYGRCAAFIPVNVFLDPASYNKRLELLQAESAQRRASKNASLA